MLTVVTGWSPSGFREYGSRFVESFVRHWPREVRCLAYVEQIENIPTRIEQRLIDAIPGCRDFINRHRANPAANGRAPSAAWKESARAAGYNFRFDAVKFCRQGFIPLAAAGEVRHGLLCWLDADVVTFRDVANGFVESLLPAGKDVAYLGRGAKHSEIGFQLYRVPAALPMLQQFRDLYATDAIFGLKEWHSAYAFDNARTQSAIAAHDMTPGRSGHVWFRTPLGTCTDHLKGARKLAGRSPERQ